MGEESRMPKDKHELLFAPAQPPGPAIPSDLPSWASKSCSKAWIQLGASESAVVSGHFLWNSAGLVVSARQSVLSKEPERVVRLSEVPARAELVWVRGCEVISASWSAPRSEAELGKCGWSLGGLARLRKSEILVGSPSLSGFLVIPD
ncbi:hypothetical protein DFH09DRAFT_1067048 [Mycena vulgaris]|nr:hypothetical protein DFH09DRAFT_1067048 [Mycena vulgaris]